MEFHEWFMSITSQSNNGSVSANKSFYKAEWTNSGNDLKKKIFQNLGEIIMKNAA